MAKIMINFGQSYHLKLKKKLSNSGLNYMYYISLKNSKKKGGLR